VGAGLGETDLESDAARSLRAPNRVEDGQLYRSPIVCTAETEDISIYSPPALATHAPSPGSWRFFMQRLALSILFFLGALGTTACNLKFDLSFDGA
jgi:hypothetical protein